jgi:hypothetical protein
MAFILLRQKAMQIGRSKGLSRNFWTTSEIIKSNPSPADVLKIAVNMKSLYSYSLHATAIMSENPYFAAYFTFHPGDDKEIKLEYYAKSMSELMSKIKTDQENRRF